MNQKSGFTLIELLVVISIISVLSSIVLVGMVVLRDRSVNAVIASDVGQYAFAIEQMQIEKNMIPFDPTLVSNYVYMCLAENTPCDGWFLVSGPLYPNQTFMNQFLPYMSRAIDVRTGDIGLAYGNLRGALYYCTNFNTDLNGNTSCTEAYIAWAEHGSACSFPSVTGDIPKFNSPSGPNAICQLKFHVGN